MKSNKIELLYKNRSVQDKYLIYKLYADIIYEKDISKPESDDFAFVFCDGRPDVEINKIEHFTCFKACYSYSKYKYPIYCFVANTDNFLNNDEWLINHYRINIIKIDPITSHKGFSDFCIKEIYFRLPVSAENTFLVSADSWPLKEGFEKFVIDNELDMIGPILKHLPALDVLTPQGWAPMIFNVPIGINGGWSFRKASKMRLISTKFERYKFKERFSPDFERVNEDLYYFYLGVGSGIIKCPTLEKCNQFGIDPLTNIVYDDKDKLPFGYHYIKYE